MVQLHLKRFPAKNNIRAVPLVGTVGPQDGVGQHCVGVGPLRNFEPRTHPANKQGIDIPAAAAEIERIVAKYEEAPHEL